MSNSRKFKEISSTMKFKEIYLLNDHARNYDKNATETRRCQFVQYLINSFWKQRHREYLRELREKQQKQSRFNSIYEISKDDIVLLIQTDKYNRIN